MLKSRILNYLAFFESDRPICILNEKKIFPNEFFSFIDQYSNLKFDKKLPVKVVASTDAQTISFLLYLMMEELSFLLVEDKTTDTNIKTGSVFLEGKLLREELGSLSIPHKRFLGIKSSGSSGGSKWIIHDYSLFFDKESIQLTGSLLGSFPLYHFGGLNTLFYSIVHGLTFIFIPRMNIVKISNSLEENEVQTFATSPTFLRVFKVMGLESKYRFKSLKRLSYGSESIDVNTLTYFKKNFPNLKLIQTYGLTEIGVIKIVSEGNDSNYFKIPNHSYKIIDNELWIKSDRLMLGYATNETYFLNRDDWFNTRDIVETKGDFLRVLGRSSDIINVAGKKINLWELEDHLRKLEYIQDVYVEKETNLISGFLPVVRVISDVEPEIVENLIFEYFTENLPRYMMPARIIVLGTNNRTFKRSKMK